jgi:hypothetical protein
MVRGFCHATTCERGCVDQKRRALKKENPDRTAAQIKRIMEAQHGWAPDERTLQRMFHRTGLTALRAPAEPAVFGRFEAERPNASLIHAGTRTAPDLPPPAADSPRPGHITIYGWSTNLVNGHSA